MENNQVATLCQIRDIYRSIADFELRFQQKYNMCLNEGMLLCSLGSKKYSSSEIAGVLCLTNSNASKVIKSVEKKGLIKRIVGKDDKRQMYFTLTAEGQKRLASIKCSDLNIPESLKEVLISYSR
jgi:DNA-binding MarR family transcriptional regulator